MPSPSGSWCFLREDQMCDRPGCTRPRHVDSLCAHHLAGATAGERSIALLFDGWDTEQKRPEMKWFVGIKVYTEDELPAHLRPLIRLLEALRK